MKKLYFNGTIYTMDENHPTAQAVAIEDDKINKIKCSEIMKFDYKETFMKKLYFNGTIYTMDENHPTAQAVAIEDDKIIEVYQEVPTDWQGEKVDLNQNVMFPGFIDGHSHFVGCANALSQCDLSQCYSFAEIEEAIKAFIQEHDVKAGPGFIDGHSHFVGCANALSQCDLSQCYSFAEIEEAIKAFIQEHDVKAGEWVVANNYDHNFLAEKAHPDRAVLDRISTDIPILLVHVSNHMGVVNSAGLKKQNIHDDVADPQGGKYGRFADHSLSGYMEENAFINFQKSISSFDLDVLKANVAKAQDLYAKYGITTIQDGMVTKELYPLYQLLAHEKALKMDVVGYIDLENSRELYVNDPQKHQYYNHFRLGGYKIFLDGSPQGRTAWMKEHQYYNHFRLGGYKIFLDGSPQGRTAWMKEPYTNSNDCAYPVHSDEHLYELVHRALEDQAQLLAHCNGDAAAKQYVDTFTNSNDCAYPVHSDEHLYELVHRALEDQAQLLAHCNGDAAAKQYVDTFEKVRHDDHVEQTYRPVMIHAQFVGNEELKRMNAIDMIPSFFVAHTYYWGDIHIENLGYPIGAISISKI